MNKLILAEKVSYLLNNLRNFNEIFRKDVSYVNVESHKKILFGEIMVIFLTKTTV